MEFVFELGDTEGDEPFPDELLRPFKTKGVLPAEILDNLVKNLVCDGVSYTEADQGTSSAGSIERLSAPSKQKRGDKVLKVYYRMVINRNLASEEKFSTNVHELGHHFCGHQGSPHENWWPDRTHLDRTEREFEAESVAWKQHCQQRHIQ